MFTRSNLELKVGIFIFIGLLILSIIIFSIGNFYSIKKGYTLEIIFSFANGINIGAPVRYAGVEVGEVQNVEVYFDEIQQKPMVKLLVWISNKALINEDARAFINTLGLLGEKYLEIIPGTKGTQLLKNKDTLRGFDPISTEELARGTKQTLLKIDEMVESINAIVGDKEIKSSIKDILSNLESFSANLNGLIADTKEGEGTLGRLFTDEKLYNDIAGMIQDIKTHPWKLLYRPKEKKEKKK